MGIKENTEAGKMAELVFVEGAVEQLGKDQPPRYYERLIELCQAKLPEKKQLQYSNVKELRPMNDIEARSFEKEKIPWGEYKGAYVGQVRLDYLTFLAEDNDFTKNVKRYVRSNHFKKRMRKEV